MATYVSLVVNIFHADGTPADIADKVNAALRVALQKEPDYPANMDIDVEIDEHTVEIDEHTGGRSEEWCLGEHQEPNLPGHDTYLVRA